MYERNQQRYMQKIEAITEFNVRFSEVDSMGVVWHGNYLKFMEDGREDFGKKYGFGYMDFFRAGFIIPVVNVECSYKRSLFTGDTGKIITRFVNTDAAKIIFDYEIYNKESNELIFTATTVQVFLDLNKELLLCPPAFYMDWKKKMGLIES